MSGHSKWSTIRRQKGIADAKRGMVFTKLGNAITIAVRQGRGLALALEKAKQANMPKENIQRAIDRGEGKLEGGQLSEALFEGFGPGGAAIMVEAVTDNVTRTASAVRNIFNKYGGSLATPGSVAYLFTRVGEIEVEGDALEKALEVGALDVEDNIIYTKPENLHRISEAVGVPGSLSFRPNQTVTVDAETRTKLDSLLEALDELDDVQDVYCNVNLNNGQ